MALHRFHPVVPSLFPAVVVLPLAVLQLRLPRKRRRRKRRRSVPLTVVFCELPLTNKCRMLGGRIRRRHGLRSLRLSPSSTLRCFGLTIFVIYTVSMSPNTKAIPLYLSGDPCVSEYVALDHGEVSISLSKAASRHRIKCMAVSEYPDTQGPLSMLCRLSIPGKLR